MVKDIAEGVRLELGEGQETAVLAAAAGELADVYGAMSAEIDALNTEHVPTTVYRQVSLYVCAEGMLHTNRGVVLIATARRMRAARLVLAAALRGTVPARRAAESIMRLVEALDTLDNEGAVGLAALARQIADARRVARRTSSGSPHCSTRTRLPPWSEARDAIAAPCSSPPPRCAWAPCTSAAAWTWSRSSRSWPPAGAPGTGRAPARTCPRGPVPGAPPSASGKTWLLRQVAGELARMWHVSATG